MAIPNPKGGEKEDDFMSRCMSDGHMGTAYSDQDQRLAVCFNSWRTKSASTIIEKIKNALKSLIDLDVTKQYEEELEEVSKTITVDGFESPEPGDLPKEGVKILAKVYAGCRKDGGEKDKCAKIAWGAVDRAGLKTKVDKGILLKIKDLPQNLLEVKGRNADEEKESGTSKI